MHSRRKQFSRKSRSNTYFNKDWGVNPKRHNYTLQGHRNEYTRKKVIKKIRTETYRHMKEIFNDPEVGGVIPECCVCLEKIKDIFNTLTECKHMFHTKCLLEWTQTSNNCPLCRNSLFEKQIHNTEIDMMSNHSNEWDMSMDAREYSTSTQLITRNDNNIIEINNLNVDNLNVDNLNVDNSALDVRSAWRDGDLLIENINLSNNNNNISEYDLNSINNLNIISDEQNNFEQGPFNLDTSTRT